MQHRLLSLAGAVGLAVAGLAGCDHGPTVTVTPNTDLADGQAVTVRGSGYSANSSLGIVQCVAGADSIDDCDGRTARSFSADGAGAYQQPLTVRRVIRHNAGQETDCAVPDSCIVASVYIHGFQGLATAPLHFAA
jgi:hypothetical protein